MGCSHHPIFPHRHHTFTIPILILLISTISHLKLFNVEGRKLPQTPKSETTTAATAAVEEEKAMWRAQIGSRPPRCDRRCGSCAARCEAIQVPTNGRISAAVAAAARYEGNSNYKPMSWKCKCGNLIFNP